MINKQLIIILLLFPFYLKGQIAPNLILSDLNGLSHNIYSYLNEGKSVLLDFFMVNCTPCAVGSEYMDNLWLDYGPNGSNQLEIISIEVYNNSNELVAEVVENWNILNPVVNLNSIPDAYIPFVNEYPNYIMICPNRIMTIFNWIDNPDTLMEWELLLNNCNYPNNYTDIKIFEPEIIHCQNNLIANINIGNVGSNDVYEIFISMFVDSIFHSNQLWNGTLPPGSTTNESNYSIQFDSDNIDGLSISFSAITPNDFNFINNNYISDISNQTITNSEEILIKIQTDNYPADINFFLKDNYDNIILEGNGLNYSPNELIEINLNLEPDLCYTFTINDNYGDGLCCSSGFGYYLISDYQDTLIYNNDSFQQKIHSFYVESEQSSNIGMVELDTKREKIDFTLYYNLQGYQIKLPKKELVYIQKDFYQEGYSTIKRFQIIDF